MLSSSFDEFALLVRGRLEPAVSGGENGSVKPAERGVRELGALKTGFRILDGRISRIEQRFGRVEAGVDELKRNVRKLLANGRPRPMKRRRR